MTNFIDVRTIALPRGGTVQVQMTQEFLDRVRQKFNIEATADVTDDHVRMFVWGATDAALKKYE